MKLPKEIGFCLDLIWDFAVLLPEHEGAGFQLILQSSKICPSLPLSPSPTSLTPCHPYPHTEECKSLHCQPLCIPLGEAIKPNLNPVCCQAGFRMFQRRKKKKKRKASSTCRDLFLKTSKNMRRVAAAAALTL